MKKDFHVLGEELCLGTLQEERHNAKVKRLIRVLIDQQVFQYVV